METNNSTLLDLFGSVIHSYTREQALEDGVLVDVTEAAQEKGFKFPVAVTRAVFESRIKPSPEAEKHGQSETGRLHDVLWMLLCEIKRQRDPGSAIIFKVIIYDNYNKDLEHNSNLVTLKAICGPGDNAEPVITIMELDED